MPYLLDSNVLIDADRDYYPLKRVPEFWDWLIHQSEHGVILTPTEMYNEVVVGKGVLVEWLKGNQDTLVLKDEADPVLVRDVVSQGYAPDLTEDEIEKIGNDPFIVAYALACEPHATVVSTEVSRPSARRGNRRLPDVSEQFGVKCINTFKLVQELNFSTGWRAGQEVAEVNQNADLFAAHAAE